MTGNKILIIEDNRLNLELATDLLAANGFVVLRRGRLKKGCGWRASFCRTWC